MPRGITEQDVIEAADALLGRGERPTIERVRAELGRGSPNTVNRHLDAWWAGLAGRIQGPKTEELPASLTALCKRLYTALREAAAEEAGRTLDAREHQLEARSRELDALRGGLQEERAASITSAERSAAEVATLRARGDTLASEVARLELLNAESVREVQRVEAVVHARDAALAQERSQHRTEVERIRAQWEGNESRWLKEIDHLRGEMKALKIQHAAELKEARDKRKGAETAHDLAVKERTALERELARRDALLSLERESRLKAEAARAATQSLVDALARQPTNTPRTRGKKAATAVTGSKRARRVPS